MGQISAIRGVGGDLRTIKDQGEYDVWSTVLIGMTQAAEQYVFSYGVGGNMPVPAGVAAITATKLETNLHVNNQFVDEKMDVYGIAIQFGRWMPALFETGGGGPAAAYVTAYADLINLEAMTLFSFYVGGDKNFSEGLVTWYGEGGGWSGFSVVNNAEILNNNVPTPASARIWNRQFSLPIDRVEKFWGKFEFLRGALAMTGHVIARVRLLGVRSRGVQ